MYNILKVYSHSVDPLPPPRKLCVDVKYYIVLWNYAYSSTANLDLERLYVYKRTAL